MSAFACVMLYVELDNFINVWVGEKFLLEKEVVILLCINFYISTMRFGGGAFNTAAGYFKQTLIKPIAEGIINLNVSLVLVQHIGMLGVFLGTAISLILGSVWVDPYVLYKNWFRKNSLEYFGQYAVMLIFTFGIGTIMHFAGSLYMPQNFFELVIHALISAFACVILVSLSTLLLPGRKDLFQRVKAILSH
jgi:O-antigen/teichoic acid export membrane protein